MLLRYSRPLCRPHWARPSWVLFCFCYLPQLFQFICNSNETHSNLSSLQSPTLAPSLSPTMSPTITAEPTSSPRVSQRKLVCTKLYFHGIHSIRLLLSSHLWTAHIAHSIAHVEPNALSQFVSNVEVWLFQWILVHLLPTVHLVEITSRRTLTTSTRLFFSTQPDFVSDFEVRRRLMPWLQFYHRWNAVPIHVNADTSFISIVLTPIQPNFEVRWDSSKTRSASVSLPSLTHILLSYSMQSYPFAKLEPHTICKIVSHVSSFSPFWIFSIQKLS